MNQSMNLAAFLDAAVARDLLSESDRVLGELMLRRANVAGDAAVPMAVAVALLSRARADGHSAMRCKPSSNVRAALRVQHASLSRFALSNID